MKTFRKQQVECFCFCCPGGDVHQPRGGEGENPRGAETVAGGRLGPHHPTKTGYLKLN